MAKKFRVKTNVRPGAWKFLLWMVVLFLLVDALAKFGVYDATSYVNPYFLPFVLSFFMIIDVGLISLIMKKKGQKPKLDVADYFSLSIAGLVLTGVILGLVGVNLAFLTVAQGFADLFLGIFVVVNIFKK